MMLEPIYLEIFKAFRPELILTAPFERRIVLLLTDTEESGAWGLTSHIRQLAQQAQLDLRMTVAVFPEDGLTFTELLYRAESDLAADELQRFGAPKPVSDRRAEAG